MLEVEFLGKKLKNPFVLASGIVLTNGKLLATIIKNGAAAVTTKSVRSTEQKGHPNPIVHKDNKFYLNAVGLAGPGVAGVISELKKFKEQSDGLLIGSIFGQTVDEFGLAARQMQAAPIDFLEIDISCPHAEHTYKQPFALDVDLAAEITRVVKKNSHVPISTKLSPAAPNIAEIAQACEAAGANALTAVNTIPGMKIDIYKCAYVLSHKTGGTSAYALKPLAIKAVWEIYQKVSIPIIGTGGVMSGADAAEMLMAGASLVGVGSSLYYRGMDAIGKIAGELEEFMKAAGYKDVRDLVGLIHRAPSNV